MEARKKIVESDPTQQEEIDRQLAVYDNVRPFVPRQSGFTKVGGTARKITRTPEGFRSVPVRQVNDSEKVDCILPPPPTQVAKATWVCETCKFDTDGEYNHGYFRGKDGQPEPCPTCGPAVARARNRRKADKNIYELVHAGQFLDRQNLPVDADQYSLILYPGNHAYIPEIEQFINGEIQEMMLTGLTGVGKTGLAISAVHEMWKADKQVLFLPMERYLDLLKENFAPGAKNNNIKAVANNVDVLVLDDIGAGGISETGFVVKETQGLIEFRHAAGLKTLITSNMTIDGLRGFWYMKSYDRTGFQPGERIASRLKGWYRIVEIKGNDLRIEE